MHKKNASLVPLTQEYVLSSDLQVDSGNESFLNPKTSPGKVLARRGSKSQRYTSECDSTGLPQLGSSSCCSSGSLVNVSMGQAIAASNAVSSCARTESWGLATMSEEEVAIAVDGHRAMASIGASGLKWSYDIRKCCFPGVHSEAVPFNEILAAELLAPRPGLVWVARSTQMHRLAIYTFRRSPSNPCSWHPRQIVLESPKQHLVEQELVQQWVISINAAVGQMLRRPRHLLVIVNPVGGNKQARYLYQSVVYPVFAKAGIKITVIETERQGHGRTIVTGMALEQLESLDGVVAIGGDGLFHEIINGLLYLRHQSDDRARCASSLRVGHIPAGSTDAVACSLNGTRSAFTAAVHIALGDGHPLDVLRIDTAGGHVDFATCMASYGFMGDLMEESEKYRWLGPKRYDLIGAKMLAHNRAYRVRVSYLPTSSQSLAGKVCQSGCQLCMMDKELNDHTSGAFQVHSQVSLKRRCNDWKIVEGEFAGVMLVIMPCRSDKSAAGVAKHGHLCDGAIHLVLVRQCSRLQYLKFLLTLSKTGLESGMTGGHVEVVLAEAVKVEPMGKESRWNVDGELLSENHITAEVHRGLINVFARGVEQ